MIIQSLTLYRLITLLCDLMRHYIFIYALFFTVVISQKFPEQICFEFKSEVLSRWCVIIQITDFLDITYRPNLIKNATRQRLKYIPVFM
jgi:hypothetical protein